MRVRPVHVVPDVGEAVRFYETLGPHTDAASAADGEGRHGVALNFVCDEPLEAVEQRLRAAGFPPEGAVVDEEWGRSLRVQAPDGTHVQIDERDRELFT